MIILIKQIMTLSIHRGFPVIQNTKKKKMDYGFKSEKKQDISY